MNAQNIYNMSVQARADFVLEHANTVVVPSDVEARISESVSMIKKKKKEAKERIFHGIISSYKSSRVINRFLDDFIDIQIKEDSVGQSVLTTTSQRNAMLKIFKQFEKNKIDPKLRDKKYIELQNPPRNLYEMARTPKLALANKATRSISTLMGNIWEDVANISPLCVSPEKDFGIKITGIDLMFKEDPIAYAQLKTMRGTLTGSQVPRSISELGIHSNPFFVACFPLGPWTFSDPSKTIARLEGTEFWSRIGINFEILKTQTTELLSRLEKIFENWLSEL